MTAAYRNRNRPRINSQIRTSSVEMQSYTVIKKFTRSHDQPLATDCCCIP